MILPPDSCIVEPANYQHMMELVDRLLASHGAARNYLAEKSRCSPAGLQNEAVLIPLVVKQETESLKCAVEVLLELYRLVLTLQIIYIIMILPTKGNVYFFTTSPITNK